MKNMGFTTFHENIITRLAEGTVQAQIANERKFFERHHFWDYDTLLFLGGSANTNETMPPYGTYYGGMLPKAALWARMAQDQIINYANRERYSLEAIKETFMMPPYGENSDLGELFEGEHVLPLIETKYMDTQNPGEVDTDALQKIQRRVLCIQAALEKWPAVKDVIPHVYIAGGASVNPESDILEADNDYVKLFEALGIAQGSELSRFFHNDGNYGRNTEEILINFGKSARHQANRKINLLVVGPNAYGYPAFYAGNIDTLIRTKLKKYFKNFKKVTVIGSFLGYNDSSIDKTITEKASQDPSIINETQKVVKKAQKRRREELEIAVLKKAHLDKIAKRFHAFAASYSRRVNHRHR